MSMTANLLTQNRWRRQQLGRLWDDRRRPDPPMVSSQLTRRRKKLRQKRRRQTGRTACRHKSPTQAAFRSGREAKVNNHSSELKLRRITKPRTGSDRLQRQTKSSRGLLPVHPQRQLSPGRSGQQGTQIHTMSTALLLQAPSLT